MLWIVNPRASGRSAVWFWARGVHSPVAFSNMGVKGMRRDSCEIYMADRSFTSMDQTIERLVSLSTGPQPYPPHLSSRPLANAFGQMGRAH